VEVTTLVESAGQLVTVGAQLVIVTSLVVYTVEVVHCDTLTLAEGVVDSVTGDEPEGPVGLAGAEGEPTGEEAERPTDTLVGDDAGEAPLEPGAVVDSLAGVDSLSVTGHTVVEIAMVDVITLVESAGQFVTVGAQLVIVISLVV
jgi:hypothetical protein